MDGLCSLRMTAWRSLEISFHVLLAAPPCTELGPRPGAHAVHCCRGSLKASPAPVPPAPMGKERSCPWGLPICFPRGRQAHVPPPSQGSLSEQPRGHVLSLVLPKGLWAGRSLPARAGRRRTAHVPSRSLAAAAVPGMEPNTTQEGHIDAEGLHTGWLHGAGGYTSSRELSPAPDLTPETPDRAE